MMSIGERISELRKNKELSQGELAKLLDISRQAVSKWENDQTSPDTLRLIRLADVLETDVEYIATGNHSTVKQPPQVITVDKIIEKTVEKPVYIERKVEIEKIVETPVIKKLVRFKYRTDPVLIALVGLVSFLLGIAIGVLF